jgi:hypothetical protein
MRVRRSEPTCGALYRFTDSFRTHPSPAYLMRLDRKTALLACAQTGTELEVRRNFFDSHYEAVR